MWHLDKPNKQTLVDYADRLLTALMNRIALESKLSQKVKNILIPITADGSQDMRELKGLLTDEPIALFQRSERLMKQIIEGYDIADLPDVGRAFKTKGPDAKQKALRRKYIILKQLESVFDYNSALGGNKYRAYKLTADANHNTCVYCNRQYAFNIEKDGGGNNNDRIARPALDHWFPKSLFPLMSLSYYNLIPSCTICNSSAKLDGVWTFNTHIHPYLTTPDVPKFKFRYKPGLNGSWEIDFDNLNGQEKNTVDALCLKEAYQAHAPLEVAELIELATKNNGTYMRQLYENILNLYAGGSDKQKAYRLLFGSEMMPDAYKNRPMSKLKRDIIEQIENAEGIRFFESLMSTKNPSIC